MSAPAGVKPGEWQLAVAAAKVGDVSLLRHLLRSERPIPRDVREWLADSVEKLVPPRRGRPTTLKALVLNLERKTYASLPIGKRKAFAIDCADHYKIDRETMTKMLRG